MPEGLTGSLSQLPLVDLLKMLAAGGQTGRLELTSGLDQGDIYLHKGEVVHADCDLQVGDVAFAKLVSWPNGQFRFEPQTPSPARSIEKPLDRLLADSARAASEREAIRRVVPNMDVVPRLARKAPAAPLPLTLPTGKSSRASTAPRPPPNSRANAAPRTSSSRSCSIA